MTIYWTSDSINLNYSTKDNKMMKTIPELTETDYMRMIVSANQLVSTIQSNKREWASLKTIPEIKSVKVEKGNILSGNFHERKIITYSFYIENNQVKYSIICHV